MIRRRRAGLLIALAGSVLASAALPNAQSFSGRVVGIADGDTITVMREGRSLRVRLDGVDTPEKGQDFANRAKQFTSALVFGETVEVRGEDTDRYGRLVARVITGGQDVSEELVRAGLAWHYVAYSNDPRLAAAEAEARSARRGLWRLADPQPPWDYRAAARLPTPGSVGPYHGNVRSHVFHRPGCQHYNCKNCTEVFETREEAIAADYRPGGICKP